MQELSVKQESSLRLTPLLEQSIKILQLDQMSLRQYLEEIALENPLLEPELSAPPPQMFEAHYLARRTNRLYAGGKERHPSIEDLPDIGSEGGLQGYISLQINMLYSGETRKLTAYLASFLDENGYLRPDFSTICRESAYSIGELHQALARLQSLDPAGIGASSLSECLLLQLNAGEILERELVSSYLSQLAFGDRRMLAKELNITQSRLQQAFLRIRSLNPRPGAIFSGGFQPQYIVPDLVVNWNEKGELEVSLAGAQQNLKPVEAYLNLLKQTNDKDLRGYLAKKWKQFTYLQNCLEKREKTLIKLGETIALYQERFFRYGPSEISHFCMQDAAAVMGVHKSTVSRAVSGKYLRCDFGTFPLKYFFVRSLRPDAPEICSLDIKQELYKLIKGENPAAPLCDEELAAMLSKRGMGIARRTVAKYRASLGIPNSTQRGRKGFSKI